MPTLSSLVSEFLEARTVDGLSTHTIKHYRISLRHFTTYAGGDTTPEDVTRKTVRGFLAHRREAGDAASSLASRHAALSTFWTWLVEEEEATVNVVKKVARPKDKIKPVPLVTEETMHALLKVEARSTFLTFRNRALLYVLWDTGVRVGELVSLNLEDINWDSQILTVRGKTGERVVPFGKATGVALRRFLRRREQHPGHEDTRLFIGARGALGEAAVFRMLRSYGKVVGVPGLHPHAFRHTWVHNLLEAGATILDVQMLGGWSSPEQVLKRYGLFGKQARAIRAHRRLSPGDRLSGM
ncbi:tyrosine-type recombinase/integrase [Nocardiopsis metallicus]|uniref:Site-specific recombinase XerD n=1 Tax=Nocardiopsis metallicus TaxID=179819 RepID=A0A840W261_9ACTN|nr:tyrosine-type recombinase/integrase [Nocardiopsis metallicus]MBB5490970.1 site-specific recombinase XerD [Nocardiopsis metallicus]